MNRTLRSLTAAALTAISVCLTCSSPGWAGMLERSYPDPSAGPYYMESDNTIDEPGPGSGWAFGMLTTCSVPHLASAYYWSSRPAQYPATTFNLTATTYDYFQDTGGSPTIARFSYTGWTPAQPGDSYQAYLPAYGDDGVRGDPTYETVPKNWSQAYCGQDMTDTVYQVGLDLTSYNYFYCTECGEGCPPP